LKIGDVVHDLGFTATAITPGAFGSGTIQIRLPKGTKAVYIDSISNYGENSYKPERELLLARGTRYRLVNKSPKVFEVFEQGDIIR
jgi:hypothetical protein